MQQDVKFDVETFRSFLHRQKTEGLADVLDSILSDPQTSLPRLEVFVLEVGLMLTRVMFLRHYGEVSSLSKALERPLAKLEINSAHLEQFLSGVPDDSAQKVSYFLGRILALLVIAERFLIFDRLAQLRADYMDGGLSQTILTMLLTGGPRSQQGILRSLRHRPKGALRINRGLLLQALRQLSKDGLVEQTSEKGGAQLIRLTPFGRRLLSEDPPWMDDVEEAYRFRQGLQAGAPVRGTHQSLLKLFKRLDREAGLEPSAPDEHPNLRRFPHVRADSIPSPDGRFLPRIVP